MEFLEDFNDDELSVTISDLLVATADSSDPLLDDSVSELLHTMRLRMQMDVVFVSEFIDGQRMFRYVDAAPGAPEILPGESNPAEESVCQRIVEGRVPELVRDLAKVPSKDLPEIPFQIGAHLSTPIVLTDKRVYGTLCCFSAAARPELVQAHLDKLRMCATLVARKVEKCQSLGIQEPASDWKLQPKAEYASPVWQQAPRRAR